MGLYGRRMSKLQKSVGELERDVAKLKKLVAFSAFVGLLFGSGGAVGLYKWHAGEKNLYRAKSAKRCMVQVGKENNYAIHCKERCALLSF